MDRSLIEAWASEADISARSVLVTIIGDTLVPVGASLWMSQMLQLTDVFGFSDRLVRTSMTRLNGEGWLSNERVGRQSRYHLTELALRESAQAAEQIYGVDDADWEGEWTLLFLNNPGSNASDSATIADHLRWNGFVRIGRDLLASPTCKPDVVRELVALIAPDVRPVIATAAFTELGRLVEEGFFLADADVDELARAYAAFVDCYERLAVDAGSLEPEVAYGVRTMMVHDLRRIRLRWPDLPAATRPTDWAGDVAAQVATTLYEPLTERASSWLGEVFGRDYPSTIPGRFCPLWTGREGRDVWV
ncbi:MAG: phenylacetic acid degradation operon negative regulatory protein [Verrucomicrobiales bacterium]|jgi:phenylacetic acid degradation operon negative regulatory protein